MNFRHVENMMGHYARQQQPELAESTKVALAELAAKLGQLQELMKQPGWHHFQAELDAQEQIFKGFLSKATDPISMARATGTLLMIDAARNWLKDEVEDITKALESVNDRDT